MITVQTVDRVLSALDTLTDQNPELESAVDFYEELLPVLQVARPSLDGMALNRDSAQTKLRQGVPLLWGEFGLPETLGTEPNIELFMTLCRLATEGGNESGEILIQAFLDGKLDLKAALNSALNLDRPALTSLAASLQADPILLEATTGYVLTPIAWAYQLAFSELLDFADWRKGYCPICGAWPILSEQRGRDKHRYLRCGRCGAGWRFNRLQCAWCDNTQQKELSFLFDPDQPTCRADTCDYCRGYIKTIITFDPLEADMLPVHDLATTFLDQMAAAEGYKRPLKRPQP